MSPRRWLAAGVLGGGLIAAACGGAGVGAQGDASSGGLAPVALAAAAGPDATATPARAVVAPRPLSEAEQEAVDGLLRREFPRTDFTLRSIDLTELLGGGPGKDGGIPSLQEPVFVSQAGGDEFLTAGDPVIALEIGGEARAYPLQILIWHEMVNDTLGGTPVVVTFCPLCNTAITFDRRVDGVERRFGVSGLLRRSDLVMYDLANESLWQQISGKAIVGSDTGARLRFLPSQIVSWADFKATFADALVLSRDTGYIRSYGLNPYPGYDSVLSPFFFPVDEFDDGRLQGKERVLTVEANGEAVAFPFSELSSHVVLEAEVGGIPVVAFWQPGALSALDVYFIVGSKNIGAAGAFAPLLDGERLRFQARDGRIVDSGTGSVWNVLGHAVSGPLAGAVLEPVVSANHFWFAWSVFQPETRVIRGGGA